MYYDDEVRRFNFLSGLLLGAVLGTGLALLARPVRTAKKRTPVVGAARRIRRDVASGARSLGERVGRSSERVLDGARAAGRRPAARTRRARPDRIDP